MGDTRVALQLQLQPTDPSSTAAVAGPAVGAKQRNWHLTDGGLSVKEKKERPVFDVSTTPIPHLLTLHPPDP